MFDLRVDNARLYPLAGDTQLSGARSFVVHDGYIAALDIDDAPAKQIYDAQNRVVMPGLIDCHTHALYAGNRMHEHALKLQGASYADIARAGGGIVSTVKAVQNASEDELIAQTKPRLAALAHEGVTTVEIKSGYGLSREHELKMLRAIRRIGNAGPQRVVASFLGAHAVPPGTTRAAYIDSVVEDMLPAVAADQLADAVDIFIESIAFDLDDARRLFERARALGLRVRAHAEQLSSSGASALAAEYGALSCDHLEYLDETGAAALARADSVAVLLPGAFYFLRETKLPPIALLRKHGVPLAVATDLNPGSSPVASLLSCLHMSVTLFGLTPDEALLGVTYNAARALGRNDLGALTPGRRADFTVWDIPEPAFLAYQLGGIAPAAVFIDGRSIA